MDIFFCFLPIVRLKSFFPNGGTFAEVSTVGVVSSLDMKSIDILLEEVARSEVFIQGEGDMVRLSPLGGQLRMQARKRWCTTRGQSPR